MKRSTNNSKTIPYFRPFGSIIMLALGILVTLFVTHIFAQTATIVIYACAQKQTGNLRMVSSNTSCRPDETAIQWNVQGPPGPQGPSGSGGGYFGLPFLCSQLDLSPYASAFVGKDFSNASLGGCTFTNVDIHGVIFKGAHMGGYFNNVDLSNADFSNIGPSRSQNGAIIYFNHSNLTNTNFTNSNFSADPNNLDPTDFTGVNLTNANFTGTDLLRDTGLDTATTTGAIWTNAICPDNSQANNNRSTPTCVGHFTPAP